MGRRRLTAALAVAALAAVAAARPGAAEGTAGDFTAGKAVFMLRCIACHEPPTDLGLTDADRATNEAALPADDAEATPTRGPTLAGLMGRTAGTVPGFAYSEAMAASGVVWTGETLRAFLLKPAAFLPRNRMPFNGLKRPGEVDDLVAYLREAAR